MLFNNSSSKSSLLKKKVLPHGWHWLYFSDNPTINEIGPDGHIKRGSFYPPLRAAKECLQELRLSLKKKYLSIVK